MANKAKKTIDDEKAEALVGGIQPEVLDDHLSRLKSLNADKAEILGDLSAVQNAFEKAGGNKAAFKFVNSLEQMEEGKRADFWHAFCSYAAARNLFPQGDLFAAMPGNDAGAGAPADAAQAAETAH